MRSFPDPTSTWSLDDARRIFDEWRRSGETLAAFARRCGVSAARLYWWRKRLAAAPREAAALSLVPATVIDETAATPAALTIRLPNGIGIEAPHATPAWIAAVVAALARSA